jgi:hypothetical protein
VFALAKTIELFLDMKERVDELTTFLERVRDGLDDSEEGDTVF